MLTHLQDLLNIHSGDEAFALFIKLVETFLIPVTQTRAQSSSPSPFSFRL